MFFLVLDLPGELELTILESPSLLLSPSLPPPPTQNVQTFRPSDRSNGPNRPETSTRPNPVGFGAKRGSPGVWTAAQRLGHGATVWQKLLKFMSRSFTPFGFNWRRPATASRLGFSGVKRASFFLMGPPLTFSDFQLKCLGQAFKSMQRGVYLWNVQVFRMLCSGSIAISFVELYCTFGCSVASGTTMPVRLSKKPLRAFRFCVNPMGQVLSLFAQVGPTCSQPTYSWTCPNGLVQVVIFT